MMKPKFVLSHDFCHNLHHEYFVSVHLLQFYSATSPTFKRLDTLLFDIRVVEDPILLISWSITSGWMGSYM